MVVCGGWGQVLQDVGVSLVAQGCEVADVQFQLTAVLIEVYEWGDNLSKTGMRKWVRDKESF